MSSCTCDEWTDNIDKMLMASYLRVHGITYDGVVMRYCPWCAATLDLPEPPPIIGPRFIEWNYDTMIATEYERLGTCNGCNGKAACCNLVVNMKMIEGDKKNHGGSTVDGKGAWSEIVGQSEVGDEREFIRFEVTDRKQEPCVELTPDKLCGRHDDDKQWCCKVFPTSPRDIATLPECSFEFRVMNNWKFEDDEE